MAEEHKCEACNRNFKGKEALEMHNSAKHSQLVIKEKKAKINFKKIKNYGIFIVILVLVGFGLFSLIKSSGSVEDIPANKINIVSHANLALHIHSNLKININGQEQLIPQKIGISQGVMRPLHTHDSSGEIHIEGPFKRDFTLGEFFLIWGETFNSTCIFDNCVDEGILKMYVNGNENNEFNEHVLKDGENILIEFTSN